MKLNPNFTQTHSYSLSMTSNQGHTRPSDPPPLLERAHQTLPSRGSTPDYPLGKAHQTFLGRAQQNLPIQGKHTRLFPGKGTPDLPGEGTPDPPLQGKHTRLSPGKGTPDLPGGHTRHSPPGEAHQTIPWERHTRLSPGKGTPDLPGGHTRHSPPGEAHQTIPWERHTRSSWRAHQTLPSWSGYTRPSPPRARSNSRSSNKSQTKFQCVRSNVLFLDINEQVNPGSKMWLPKLMSEAL